MSGGVGPTGDICLPSEKQEHKHLNSSFINAETHKSRRGFLSFRHLNALAVIVVFTASGMVSIGDFAFVVFSLVYVYVLSTVVFPTRTPSMESLRKKNKLMGLYISVTALVGLFLPIGYIFEGIFEGDKERIKAAAPHVFLLASQLFMEGLTFSTGFSTPVRMFVPVFYNSRRIFTIVEWLTSEISKVDYGGSPRRLYVGKALAIANLVLWCFNLFGLLLPVYLPMAFKRYYESEVKK